MSSSDDASPLESTSSIHPEQDLDADGYPYLTREDVRKILADNENLSSDDLEDSDLMAHDAVQGYATPPALTWNADAVGREIRTALQRTVDGLDGVLFQDICDAIKEGGYHVYVYGGFLRDLFRGVIGDDIDLLFTCPVPWLAEQCDAHGWAYHLKTSEKTGDVRDDFIAIGDKEAKQKFSGHTLGSGCQGEFACNMMVYDVNTDTLVDPSSYGVGDASLAILRVPLPMDRLVDWVEADRLFGMRVVRFFNFRARGFREDRPETLEWMVNFLLRAFDGHSHLENESEDHLDNFILDDETSSSQRDELIAATMRVFLRRKVFRHSVDKSLAKEKAFRRNLVACIDDVMGLECDGSSWYKQHIASLYPLVSKRSRPQLERTMTEVVALELDESKL